MSFDKNNFEKLRFDPFGYVLLKNTNDSDKNIFNNLSLTDSVFHAVEEAATSFKKFHGKTVSVTLERNKSQSKL